MTDATRALLEQVLRLPPEARAAIAGSLIESLDEEMDERALELWESVVAERIRALESRSPAAVPWSQARRQIAGE